MNLLEPDPDTPAWRRLDTLEQKVEKLVVQVHDLQTHGIKKTFAVRPPPPRETPIDYANPRFYHHTAPTLDDNEAAYQRVAQGDKYGIKFEIMCIVIACLSLYGASVLFFKVMEFVTT